VSRHARRRAADEHDRQRAGDHGPPAETDPVSADYGTQGRWPPDDLTGPEPGPARGFPGAARRHARPDAWAADQGLGAEQPWPPEPSQATEPRWAAEQTDQMAEPYRWTPDRTGATPDPYAWVPDHGEGAPGYGAGGADYRSGAGDDMGGPTSYETGAAGYDSRTADYRSGAADYHSGAADLRGGAGDYRGGASDYLKVPPDYENEVPDYGSGPDYGGAVSGHSQGTPPTLGAPWGDDTGSGPLPPLPPPSLPGPGHPSGPLPPLPPSELAWRQSLADPLLTEPEPDLQANGGYGDDTYPDSAATAHPGYQPYGDDPGDQRASVAQEARGYPESGGWYGDVEEPQAWAEDEEGFLPGLDDSRSTGRRSGRGPGNGSSRKRRTRGRMAFLVAGLVIAAILVAVGGVGYSYLRKYVIPPDFAGPGTGSIVVQIKPGETASTVGQRLAALGVVDSARAFSLAAKDSSRGRSLEPGYYRLHRHMKASLAFALLLTPSSRVQTRIAIPEGYRLSQIIATLGKQTGNLKGYQQAVANPASLGLPAFAKGSPEGYLFPATYDIQPQTSPLAVLRSMVLRFDQEAASVSLPSAAARAQLSESDVITVASLIQAEGKRPQDLPKIARVIYNRLNQSPPMPLQLDTTVLYALHSSATDVTIPQTQVNSPYNTYLHAGLPPGPIDSPGDAAIQAALHPAAGNWTYFLTVDPKTGLTLFTNSFTQFQQFQAQLSKNRGTG